MSTPDELHASELAQADYYVVCVQGSLQLKQTIQTVLSDEPLVTVEHLDTAMLKSEQTEQLPENMQRWLPDVLLIEADALKASDFDPRHWFALLRQQPGVYRSVLLVYGNLSEAERIQYLIDGADDALSDTMSPEELKIRILAHLRRSIEGAAHPVTQLPGFVSLARVMQRRMNSKHSWALMLISLDHFDIYREVYGELPANQVLKSFAAMLARSVLVPDMIAQTDGDEFLILTQPDKVEKLAALLCRQFESAAPNFYSEKDRKQGYLIALLQERVSRRIPLLSLSIGACTSKTRSLASVPEALHVATTQRDIAAIGSGNAWHVESHGIEGRQESCLKTVERILVLESDAALAFLLKTVLEMSEYQVTVVSTVPEAQQELSQADVSLVILDALLAGEVERETMKLEQASGLAFCRLIRETQPDLPVICTSTLHQRELVLKSGADLYLPKPFEMVSLLSWVDRLLR